MERSLTELKTGESAVIKRIEGGLEFQRKMSLLNIRPGKKLEKIASHPMMGPIVIGINNRQITLGRGMAAKIIVEV